jgi:predicted lipid-binding transport protein (Tim44 family)
MRRTCRLWLAIDMVTTKLDTSMGGTAGGASCEGEEVLTSASAVEASSPAASSIFAAAAAAGAAGGAEAASFDIRRRLPGDILPSSRAKPMG